MNAKQAVYDVIRGAIANHPRSLQKRIGPSEIGTPCDRRIGYKLLGQEENPRGDAWKPTVGTAVHGWLERAFDDVNLTKVIEKLGRLGDNDLEWITEQSVTVGYLADGTAITGSCDLYHRPTGTVIDHKGLHVDTPIPTPDGWTTMGRLQVGDAVFGRDGRTHTVTRVYPVNMRDCYRIVWSDGTSIVCDDIHQWPVEMKTRRYAEVLRSTAELADDHLRHYGATSRPERVYRSRNTAPLELPEQDLPIDPYVLGAWLGDGNSWNGTISKPDDELFDEIGRRGYRVSEPYRDGKNLTRNVHGLAEQTRLTGLRRNKHIPAAYLRGSLQQRLDLVRGLMDTDGSWNSIRNQAIFSTTDKQMAADFMELCRSLGWNANNWEQTRQGFGLTVTAYDVAFNPHDHNPFILPRKANKVRMQGSARSRHRVIKSVTKIPTVPTVCIDVDAPDHVFLAGEGMIPTHNCVGLASLRDKKANGPGQQYRAQVHMYGAGFLMAGHKVEHVAINFLPQNGNLTDGWWWTEPFDMSIAAEAITRLRAIEAHVATSGSVEGLTAADAWCAFCPFHLPGSTDLSAGCPGMTASRASGGFAHMVEAPTITTPNRKKAS